MTAPRKTAAPADEAPKPAGPGRPKDLSKRAAILEAATRMFIRLGYDATSMDQIAAEAGVSKLTVYSHFGDKEALFLAAVKAHCERFLPTLLFEPSPETPLRERLLAIAEAFWTMLSSPEAVQGHRMLCSPQLAGTPLAQMFWEVGPQRTHDDFAALLRRRVQAGELAIEDVDRAAGQFFALLEGEPYERLVYGCGETSPEEARAHTTSSVDLFLRAYASQR
ncbi:TetR/AcrR family transcriptional regulator [Lysobacter silvisoli]|uniref:TetR/AcrR family transcriptional regulator n=1 Tax=Lysobacter silvisoli TaxID=2293254 RepID=A0A371JX16_9GAMM|nr:TetR/AcrR family transcriptional regulator [Lysobacter silvisoli]RDZ26191.1 TetR/AcrR family transcriptional regulator [Lysobacter silvisoli]